MSTFIIKKHPGSVDNPWLGTVPGASGEVFGRLTNFLLNGKLSAFPTDRAAFEHIRRGYPSDVNRMQVYEMVESPDGIALKHCPWP